MRREVAAWTALMTGGLVAGWAGVVPLTGDRGEIPSSVLSTSGVQVTRYPADSFATLVVARGLFRSTRRPAAIAYDPSRGLLPETPAMPKPVLSLVGLVAGRPPSAVIEGFPGVEGSRVVRAGDVVAGLRVIGINADAVRLVGMDTTWVLRLREPWK